MTTPNIPTWRYRVKVNGTWEGDAMKLEIDDLRSALQSQAERITQWEVDFNELLLERDDARAERDTLRAQLVQIAATEPVAEVNSLINAALLKPTPVGTKLFTRPMPQDVTELEKDAERYRHAKLYNLLNGWNDENIDRDIAIHKAVMETGK